MASRFLSLGGRGAAFLLLVTAAVPAARAQGCAQVPATGAVAARSDTSCLGLDQAIARALAQNADVRIARNTVDRAEAEIKGLLSTAYPKLDGSITYVRTFDSPFRGGGTTDTTGGFKPDTTASLADRVRYLETTPNLDFGNLFGGLPFGQANAYTFALSGSQTLYNGGKFRAVLRIRDNYREQVRLVYEDAAAAAEQAVREAYIRALLAQSLREISQASLEQAERFAGQVRQQRDAGKASDLDLLRAEVAFDNLRPQEVQSRRATELAALDLKRLLDLPMGMPLRLTTPLEAPASTQLTELPADPATLLRQRPSVQAQERQVRVSADEVIVARAAHMPHLDLRMNYGKQIYPDGVFGFGGQSWRTDWTGTLALSIPIFAGGAARADIDRARLAHDLDKIRLQQITAGVQLEFEQALGNRESAASAIAARQRTVDQAQRVYDLTVLRFESGVSTQLEVSDARLALLQARTNLAQATADLLVADAGVARALGISTAARSLAR